MNVEKLRQSIEKNNAASIVRVMPFAVGSSDREVEMQIDSISNSGNGEVPPIPLAESVHSSIPPCDVGQPARPFLCCS